jgi:hypothetical protein
MSKLYMMNRMRSAPAAGDLFSIIGGAAKLVGGLFKSKAAKTAAAVAKKIAANPLAQTAAIVGAGEVAGALLAPGGGGSRGVSGGWRPRRKGITATELRGFRKVAKLLHNEGMTIKKHRRS